MRINFLSKFFVMLLVVLGIMFLTSCTEKQEEDAIDKYGHELAYITYNGYSVYLYQQTANYYVNGVSGDYSTAALWAVTKGNASSLGLSIGSSGSSTSYYRFYTYSSGDSKNGYNTLSLTSTGQIVASSINLNSYYLQYYTLDGKKHIAVHEMGHTFGLKDQATAIEGYTIMWYSYSNGSSTFTNYQEFDLENIQWKYGY